NIIVFGEAGSGKSSLVNMITGKDSALVANSAAGVTFESKHYNADLPDGQLVTIWDTAGLDEAPGGTVDPQTAIGNLYKLTRSLDSVHLLVYCVRQRITLYTVKNYRIFHAICDGKVPIAIVINGLELDKNIGNWWSDNQKNFADMGWWKTNEASFKRAGMEFEYQACIAGIRGNRIGNSNSFAYGEAYDASAIDVNAIITRAYHSRNASASNSPILKVGGGIFTEFYV
ncbi:hypothetical protein FIBSPDRAFT_754288, partial [Athelia psychrophila]